MSRHIRNLALNAKLKSVYTLLKKRAIVSNWQIINECKIVNPGGIISEINAQIKNYGEKIVCYRYDIQGNRKYFYKLTNVA